MKNLLQMLVERRPELIHMAAKLKRAAQIGVDLAELTNELEKKEVALIASEAKYRAFSILIECVVDNIPDFIWAKDLERRYLFSNKALRNLFQVDDKNALLGKTEETLIAEKRAIGCPVDIKNIEVKEMGQTNSSTIYLKKGTVNGFFFAWQVHRTKLTNGNGDIIGTVSVARDVTHTYEYQED